MLRSLRLLLATALVFPFAGCETIGNLNLYSDDELEPLSAQAYAEVATEYTEIKSGAQYEMVRRVAQKIAAASEENFAWEVKLLKADDTPNAFCLPNGRIAVYTGILPLTQNENGLAAVLGHEVAHAVLRHGGKRMTQGLLTNVAATAIDAGLGIAEMSEDTRGVVMGVIGAGAQYGVLLPYSREHESEADILGIRYAIRAGYDPNEAPKLWERMAELGSGTPEWMSTHPHPLARAEKLREVIPQIIEEEKNWQPK
ncbi:MAG: M48 family metallopeptidase [Planctomycetes bacterium]|nr:M48 family metallopeptidase [Planctomycetota bacterium]